MTLFLIMTTAAIVTLILVSAFMRLMKLNKQQADNIAGLQNQLAILCTGAVGTDERIIKFEQMLQHIKEQQNRMSMGAGSATPSYDHAIRLARKGVGVNQLIDNCNLSDEEAHLISRLHGAQLHTGKQELH